MIEDIADCGSLCPTKLDAYRTAFMRDPRNRVALNAVTKTSVNSVAMSRSAVVRANHTYSHIVKAGASTSQNKSGRCWMFAGLNLFRMSAAEQMKLEDLELSQNYLMFWDKLEKSNYFLESILQTLEEPADGRLVAWLLANPIQDGGQWDMFVNLVKKYGVVPKEVMPETESSSASHLMNDRVTYKLREDAARLRQAHARGEAIDQLRAHKTEMVAEIYRMLCIHLGEPPAEFNWQWRDKDKEFHRDGMVTPQQFREKYVTADLDSMVCLIHCPQGAKRYEQVYTIAYLGNVVGGQTIKYLNVEIDVLKRAAIAMIKEGRPVWFGCDVGKSFDRDLGVMDAELYDYEGLYGVPFGLSKPEMLDYGQSLMTHAMVLTGVDLDEEDRPRKWRVENSWGDKGGDKGFMVMTDAWFDAYLYEIVIDKSLISSHLVALLDREPEVLPPWDPMGSLAAAV
ncbi:MAG TPA: C1 family peptidase [Chthonomonadaceae bacterium]|nr:C1 family peptidase [Chthonomonadaceae bacterium]